MTDSGGPEDPEVAKLREQLAAAERVAELRAELAAAQADLETTEREISKVESAAERKAHLQRVSSERAERLAAAAAEGEAKRLQREQAAQEAEEARIAERRRLQQEQRDRKAERRADRANREADQRREEAVRQAEEADRLRQEEAAIKAAVETPSEGETPFEESRQNPGTSDHDDRTNQPSLRQGVLALLAIGAVVVVILFATGTVKDRLKIECRTNELYRGMEVLVSYDPPNDQPSPRINDGINRSRVAVDFSDGTDQVEYVNFYKEPKQYLVTHSYRSPGTYTITVAVGGNSDSCEVTILGQADD